MKKIVRLTESDLVRLVKRVIKEGGDTSVSDKIKFNKTFFSKRNNGTIEFDNDGKLESVNGNDPIDLSDFTYYLTTKDWGRNGWTNKVMIDGSKPTGVYNWKYVEVDNNKGEIILSLSPLNDYYEDGYNTPESKKQGYSNKQGNSKILGSFFITDNDNSSD